MTSDPDTHYEKTHKLLDAARTAIAGDETQKALTFLIEAVQESTFGWGAMDYGDADADADDPPAEFAPSLPDLSTIMIKGRNCVSILNEHAQKLDKAMPRYEFEGTGPFRCICHFLEEATSSSEERRTKNEAKHDAAVRMLAKLRGED